MNVNQLLATFVAAMGLFTAAIATADEPKDAKAAKPEIKLPPGWTAADLQSFMVAATPGKMHELMAQDVGEWEGKNTMWMGPGTEPVQTKCTSTVTPLFDGRFFQCEMAGEMPGMGPYKGLLLSGYDNVAQKFVSTWIDNMGTTMAVGEGELSKDGKSLTWNYTFTCPITKKPTVMRQVETLVASGKKTLEMFGPDPKTGQEYQMMRIELTKK